VVYSKRPFGGPEQVLAYLSRYIHRVGGSNRRLVDFDGSSVTFRYKDYADQCGHKTMRLAAAEFVRRLRLHLLPAPLGHPEAPVAAATAGSGPSPQCPHCRRSALVLVRWWIRRRSALPSASVSMSLDYFSSAPVRKLLA